MIGPLLVDGTQPIGLTGLAFQPGSNRLFGITAGIVEGLRPVLVSIDPSTAEARVIGRLTHPLTDISFAPNGQLYGWTADTGQLGLVDTQNGKVTPIGAAREPPVGGGFAIDGLGNAFVAAGNAADTIDQVDLQSGAVSPGPTIRDAPYLSAIGAMAFSPSGELYAANSIRSTPIKSILLTIDRGSGVTHVVGDLPEDTDAIAFTSQEPMLRTTIMRSVSYLAIAVFVVLAFFFLRSRVVKRGRA